MHFPYRTFPWGDTIDGSNANFWESGDEYEIGDYSWTTPVGYYEGGQTPEGTDMANGYGMYDMAGSVYEWCHDWWENDNYEDGANDNPHGPEESPDGRVLRGGSWNFLGGDIQCYVRDMNNPYAANDRFGFRLVLEAE